MIAGVVPHNANPTVRGSGHGHRHRAAIRSNIRGFLAAAAAAGWDVDRMLPLVRAGAAACPAEEQAELAAIADAAGVSRDALLLFALGGHVVAPEECTVVAAVGSASATGSTVLLKNSDKIGADAMVGTGYHRYKEINVVLDRKAANGTRILGVAAAGSTGLKMGVNDAGIAAASNIVRTTELRRRRVGLDDLRALDRGRLLRDGLELRSVQAAADRTTESLTHTPMATPGNVHFADADRMIIVEASYDRLAVERVQHRVVVRANAFVLLADLNDPQDTSSPSRYARALEMIAPVQGNISEEHLRAVSRDHHNGPGLASICRHSDQFTDETSVSAMIASLHPTKPAAVAFALGKPCWAWEAPRSVLRMTTADEAVPQRFTNGDCWRDSYREEARPG